MQPYDQQPRRPYPGGSGGSNSYFPPGPGTSGGRDYIDPYGPVAAQAAGLPVGAPEEDWPAPPPRKRRRVFPWVFLAIQVLFAVWVVAGIAGGGSIHSQAVAYCHAHPDRYLPFSQCVSDYGGGAKAGTAIGAGLVVLLWAVVDVILGVSYGVWRLARR